MDDITFYDANGKAVAYIHQGQDIYLYTGEPVAYLQDGEFVYAYSGRFLGWFKDGWIRDKQGSTVLFTEIAKGGPLKPLRQLKPLKGLRKLRPLKGLKQLKPLRPLNRLSWSSSSGESFFA